MKTLLVAHDIKEKIMNIAQRTNEFITKQSPEGTLLVYEELNNIWKYLNRLQSFETKYIIEIIINMSIAFEAYFAGAITKEELITNILKNKIVSELINHLKTIN
ncbi:MAG: hypothetical protein QW327_02325 [Candidatus Odinarchaeota archaeon]